jgi:hypothetical protein
LPDSLEMLQPLTPFPLGAVLTIAGVLCLLAIDFVITARMAQATGGGSASGDRQADACHQPEKWPEAWQADEKDDLCAAPDADAKAPARPAAAPQQPAAAAPRRLGGACRACAPARAAAAPCDGAAPHPHSVGHSHHHAPDHPLSAPLVADDDTPAAAKAGLQPPARKGEGSLQLLRQLVACYTLEAGCVFHSVIIGVGIGVTVGCFVFCGNRRPCLHCALAFVHCQANRKQVKRLQGQRSQTNQSQPNQPKPKQADDVTSLPPLIVAMAFHQALEAVALGAVMAAAPLITRARKVLMVSS